MKNLELRQADRKDAKIALKATPACRMPPTSRVGENKSDENSFNFYRSNPLIKTHTSSSMHASSSITTLARLYLLSHWIHFCPRGQKYV